MEKIVNPIIIDFPLRGEWCAPTSPATRIPSHGTNALGTRYALDFLQVDWQRKGTPCYETGVLRYLVFGIPIRKCFCYGKDIYAPCGGTVVSLENNWPERKRIQPAADLLRAGKNSRLESGGFENTNTDFRNLTGNYIIIKHSEHIYAAFCHLLPGSIAVSVGEEIHTGDLLGKIGHSGNSMFPHLHFQLMDSPDISSATGLPCAFARYERFESGVWKTVYQGLPAVTDRIRFYE